uniref:Glutamate--cysteine ligase n=1 Tax=Candidatus Aschnera chinzeii TaxID=1485666 RepID=A0AAT9G4Y7_9ENTR|nr:MAG: glutamate--cysteine ligase [Candidatus Aschnera chinzeii]
MFSDISKTIAWLNANFDTVKCINRGIERETLRITTNGTISVSDHPKSLGSSLTHPWITTDFAESLLEFITPTHNNIDYILSFLKDLYYYTINNLTHELLWPLSIPCDVANVQNIKIAQYGTSNLGRFKTLYRKGLKNRYGTIMQTIAGIHYNFSLPIEFWQAFIGVKDYNTGKHNISNCYLNLIRNYYRFGWIITYLFGASPAICKTLMETSKSKLPFEIGNDETYYLPYATSLRMSDIGYTNQLHKKIKISYNDIYTYIHNVRLALKTKSKDFLKLETNNNRNYLQLNANILQIENELYAPIRPKRTIKPYQSLINALMSKGIEYIEIRNLDINPFTPIGINKTQIDFLDLFLIWCLLMYAPKMNEKHINCCISNWDQVVTNGRKPGQKIQTYLTNSYLPLKMVGQIIFEDLFKIASVLDKYNNTKYYNVCSELIKYIDNPDYTYSARILSPIIQCGLNQYGLKLADEYYKNMCKESYDILSLTKLIKVKQESILQQINIENNDSISFHDYLIMKTTI